MESLRLSPRKLRLLALLRAKGPLSLEEISDIMGITKTAVLKHIQSLEEEGLVEREYRRHGRGRPIVLFKASRSPQSSEGIASIALEALRYIEETLGKEHVSRILWSRNRSLIRSYSGLFRDLKPEEKIKALARLRDREGYMAKWRKINNHTYEIIEENCPIILVSQRYSEACIAEVSLFSTLLNAEVEATHRIVEGAPICMFKIRFKVNHKHQ